MWQISDMQQILDRYSINEGNVLLHMGNKCCQNVDLKGLISDIQIIYSATDAVNTSCYFFMSQG